MANDFFGGGYTPSINVTEGLAGADFDPNGFKRLQGGSVKSTFGGGGTLQDQFRIGLPQGFADGLAFSPATKTSMFDGLTGKFGGVFDKVGGLSGISTLLGSIGALQSAGLQKDRLKEAKENNAFNQGLARANFNTQAQTLNTQMADRQDTRNARSAGNGLAQSTADYMAANRVNGFNG